MFSMKYALLAKIAAIGLTAMVGLNLGGSDSRAAQPVSAPCPATSHVADNLSDVNDFVGRAKWEAWSALKGTPIEQARQDYIDLVQSLK
jgi:hypothetical protein